MGEARLAAKAAEQIVLQGGAVPGSLPIAGGETHRLAVHCDTELGRRGEWFALDVFVIQCIAPKRPASHQGFVGGVASAGDGAQAGAQFFICFHGRPPISVVYRLSWRVSQ